MQRGVGGDAPLQGAEGGAKPSAAPEQTAEDPAQQLVAELPADRARRGARADWITLSVMVGRAASRAARASACACCRSRWAWSRSCSRWSRSCSRCGAASALACSAAGLSASSWPGGCGGRAASRALAAIISSAESRSSRLSYLSPIASVVRIDLPFLRRQRADARARRLDQVRWTGDGEPSGWSSETSASPIFSSVIALATSIVGIGPEGLGGRLHRLLVARREGAELVLDAVAELAGDLVGDVDRVLRDEIDADALGADQPDDLLDLLQQGRRRVVEQQVGFVEEEGELGLVGIADLRKLLEQLGEQPQQEGRIEPRDWPSACRRRGC